MACHAIPLLLTLTAPQSGRAGGPSPPAARTKRTVVGLVGGAAAGDVRAGVKATVLGSAAAATGPLVRAAPLELMSDVSSPRRQVPETDAVAEVVPTATDGAVPGAVLLGVAVARSQVSKTGMRAPYAGPSSTIIVSVPLRANKFTVPGALVIKRSQTTELAAPLPPLTSKMRAAARAAGRVPRAVLRVLHALTSTLACTHYQALSRCFGGGYVRTAVTGPRSWGGCRCWASGV